MFHNFLNNALQNQRIEKDYIDLIERTYTEPKARIITDIEVAYFEIGKEVKQGDPLSPLIFNIVLKEIRMYSTPGRKEFTDKRRIFKQFEVCGPRSNTTRPERVKIHNFRPILQM